MDNDMMFFPPEAVSTVESLTLKKCIDFFESGAERIYLVDEHGRYSWHAVEKQKLRLNEQGVYSIETREIPPVVTALPPQSENLEKIKGIARTVFENHTEAMELLGEHENESIVKFIFARGEV